VIHLKNNPVRQPQSVSQKNHNIDGFSVAMPKRRSRMRYFHEKQITHPIQSLPRKICEIL